MSEDRGDTDEQRIPQTQPAKPSTSVPSGSRGTGEQKTSRARPANQSTPTASDEGVVWVRIAPSQVVRTVAVALLTAAGDRAQHRHRADLPGGVGRVTPDSGDIRTRGGPRDPGPDRLHSRRDSE